MGKWTDPAVSRAWCAVHTVNSALRRSAVTALSTPEVKKARRTDATLCVEQELGIGTRMTFMFSRLKTTVRVRPRIQFHPELQATPSACVVRHLMQVVSAAMRGTCLATFLIVVSNEPAPHIAPTTSSSGCHYAEDSALPSTHFDISGASNAPG